jgi:hypothetical protein
MLSLSLYVLSNVATAQTAPGWRYDPFFQGMLMPQAEKLLRERSKKVQVLDSGIILAELSDKSIEYIVPCGGRVHGYRRELARDFHQIARSAMAFQAAYGAPTVSYISHTDAALGDSSRVEMEWHLPRFKISFAMSQVARNPTQSVFGYIGQKCED